MNQNELHHLIIYQDRYFEILTEFFVSVTGCLPHKFATLNNFPESIHRMASKFKESSREAEKAFIAFSILERNLKKLYTEEGEKALENYKAEMRRWRTEDWCKKSFSNRDIDIVTNAIFERIIPNYHLLENADEFRSHPLLCISAQAHYYQLIANMKNSTIGAQASFDPSVFPILQSLNSKRLDYLANINDSQLVMLRKTNENIEFRRDLRNLVNSLSDTKLDDLGYVTAEVCSHIESSVSKHEKQVSSLNSKYEAKNKYTALVAVSTLGVTMFPVLAPFLGALLPIGGAFTAGKYISDKFDKKAERESLSHSMFGVISLAKSK